MASTYLLTTPARDKRLADVPDNIGDLTLICARYRADAAQAIADATAYVNARFDTKDEDTHTAVTTGASWNFKAPLAGLYLVSVSMNIDFAGVGAGGNVTMELWVRTSVDGAAYANRRSLGRHQMEVPANPIYGFNGSQLIRMVKNETLQIGVYQNSGASRNTYYDGTNHVTTIGIVRVGG